MVIKLVSPHRDDAAFSCGIFLSLCADVNAMVQVINAFTHSDYAPFAELRTADGTSELRKNEDAALQKLLADSLSFLDLALWDAPLRLGISPEMTVGDPLDSSSYQAEVERVESAFRPVLIGAHLVLLPMAIGNHIDHRIARDAAMRCVPFENRVFYEDLPYAAALGEYQTNTILAEVEPGKRLEPILVRRSDGAARKELYASCYGSQIAPSTVAAMAAYAENRNGGETFYAGAEAALRFRQIFPVGNETRPPNEL